MATRDQEIVALAVDLITTVSPDVLARARSGNVTRPMVSPRALAALADAIEEEYPGAIAEVYGAPNV